MTYKVTYKVTPKVTYKVTLKVFTVHQKGIYNPLISAPVKSLLNVLSYKPV